MAQSGSEKPGVLDLLTSPLTLGPAVLGIGAAIVLWAMEWDMTLSYIAAGVGLAVAVAMFGLLYVSRGGKGTVPAEVAQSREDLMTNLETLSRSLQRRG